MYLRRLEQLFYQRNLHPASYVRQLKLASSVDQVKLVKSRKVLVMTNHARYPSYVNCVARVLSNSSQPLSVDTLISHIEHQRPITKGARRAVYRAIGQLFQAVPVTTSHYGWLSCLLKGNTFRHPLTNDEARKGYLLLDELEQHYDLLLTSDEADTVAGLILTELGRTAQPGDVVETQGARFEVATIERLAIATVIVTLPAGSSPNEVPDDNAPDARSNSHDTTDEYPNSFI